ncbi:hypothetical protein ACFL0Q_06345 [Thermodesulfobacteriota bacterium]
MKDCEVSLKRQHGFGDYLYWNLVLLVPVVTAADAILKTSIWWLVAYMLVAISLLILVYRCFCTHCPHYVNSSNGTRCMFLWGIPRYFTPRPGPMNLLEKTVSMTVPLALAVFPLPWLWQQRDLLVIYVLSLGVALATMLRYECVRCTYSHCPVNRVPDELRDQVAGE